MALHTLIIGKNIKLDIFFHDHNMFQRSEGYLLVY